MPRRDLVQFRRGTAAEWSGTNPTLAPGEPGWETDTGVLKIGDGGTQWNALPGISGGGGGGGGPLTRVQVATLLAAPADTLTSGAIGLTGLPTGWTQDEDGTVTTSGTTAGYYTFRGLIVVSGFADYAESLIAAEVRSGGQTMTGGVTRSHDTDGVMPFVYLGGGLLYMAEDNFTFQLALNVRPVEGVFTTVGIGGAQVFMERIES